MLARLLERSEARGLLCPVRHCDANCKAEKCSVWMEQEYYNPEEPDKPIIKGRCGLIVES